MATGTGTGTVTTAAPVASATRKAIENVEKEVNKAFIMIKAGNFAEASFILEDLHNLDKLVEDINAMLEVCKAAPLSKSIDEMSIRDQLQDLYPAVMVKKDVPKKKFQGIKRWLEGQK